MAERGHSRKVGGRQVDASLVQYNEQGAGIESLSEHSREAAGQKDSELR